MRFSTLFIALLSATAGGVFAEEELPKQFEVMRGCAVRCYADAASKSGCHPEDFACVCQTWFRTPMRMGSCLERKDCTGLNASNSLTHICRRLEENPPSSKVEAASSVVTKLKATATASPTASLTETGKSAAGANKVAFGGVMVAAAVMVTVL
ncbi:hypothetical protein PG999_010043 [Apiospora kogelbergensis]|uniref:CFEM domain-containing protein n=1 Tax=Apiospora kogelbergensis TaxID=1337665 RepID=A0AAW0QMR5_9PEZI